MNPTTTDEIMESLRGMDMTEALVYTSTIFCSHTPEELFEGTKYLNGVFKTPTASTEDSDE